MTKVNTAGANDVTPYVRALIAGFSGADNTRFALTAPNVVVAATAPSMTVLAKAGARYVNIETLDDLYALKLALTGTPEEITERFGSPVETLVIDCLDELQRKLLVARLKKDRRIDTNYEDWNWISQKLNAVYEGFNELDVHIITLTHLSNIDETSAVKPNIQGAFGTQIHNYVDYAFWLRSYETLDDTVADVLVKTDGNELEIESNNIIVGQSLVTGYTPRAEWVHDNTNALPQYIDLTFENDFDILVQSRKELALGESSYIVISDDPEEVEAVEETQVVEEEIPTIQPEAETKDDTVPGMSNADQIKKLLAEKRKNNRK